MITEYRLNMIKRSIVNEKELFNNDFEIKELTKNVCENINCYAYSLGIMEPAPSGTNLYLLLLKRLITYLKKILY